MTHDMTQSIISRGGDESGGLSPLHRFLRLLTNFREFITGRIVSTNGGPRMIPGVHIKYHPLVIARLEQEEHSRPPSMKNEG